MTIAGNNRSSNILLTDPSHLTTLAFAGFANNSTEDLDNAVITLNVPDGFDATAVVTPSDATKLKGLTSYRHELTLADGTTVTYSTKAAVLSSTAVPDTSSYVDAAHVTDWGSIRSVLITIPEVDSSTMAGHFIFILNGIDPTLAVDAGKTESVESGLYIAGLKMTPLIYRDGDERTPTITVSGRSTITAQLAYADASGTEHVVPLPNLIRHLKNNEDLFAKSDYPQTMDALKAKEGGLVPAGYKLGPYGSSGTRTRTIRADIRPAPRSGT